jgi:low temperature requirement protein LtrA
MSGRDPGEEHRASTPLELLFDLTFVVAVARAALELREALAQGHAGHALWGYAVVFFGLWWAWVNFTWFASAYDTDDVPYRLLTLLQMAGVLVFSAGITAAFQHFDFATCVAGYVIMRMALVAQWLRAARGHPVGRAATLRYAAGVTVLQLCWIGRLWLPGPAGVAGLIVLGAAELAVPAWAEFRGRITPWHPGHIAERYGGFTIIVLGEVIAAIAAAVQDAVDGSRASPGLFTTAAAGLVLVFALWWSYFKHSVVEAIRQSLRWTFLWAFAHYLIFAAVAALGAGLQVAIETLTHATRVSPAFAAFSVAIPGAIYVVVLALLAVGRGGRLPALSPTLLASALVLAAAAATPVVTLPASIVIMAVLACLLLAYHLARAGVPRPAAAGPSSDQQVSVQQVQADDGRDEDYQPAVGRAAEPVRRGPHVHELPDHEAGLHPGDPEDRDG